MTSIYTFCTLLILRSVLWRNMITLRQAQGDLEAGLFELALSQEFLDPLFQFIAGLAIVR